MPTIQELTQTYADKRTALTNEVGAMQAEVEAIKQRHIGKIKRLVAAAADAHSELYAAVEAAPDLFTKPKTITVAGVRVGYVKQKGKVVIDDEEKTIARIRDQLPKDQAELLIRTKESVHKPAVYDLVAGDLKRLGIKIEDDTEEVMIKPVDSDTDKLVNALLAEAEKIEEAA